MNRTAHRPGFLLAAAAALLSSATLAQSVVRCGNAYGEAACPGGTTVPAADPRTPAQRAQAAEVITRDGRLADTLEAARLKAEAQAQPVPQRPAAGSTRTGAPKASKASSPSKSGSPPLFKAMTPTPGRDAARAHKVSNKAADAGERKKAKTGADARGTRAITKTGTEAPTR